MRNGKFINVLQRCKSLRKITFHLNSPLTLCQNPNHNPSNEVTRCRATSNRFLYQTCQGSEFLLISWNVLLGGGEKYKILKPQQFINSSNRWNSYVFRHYTETDVYMEPKIIKFRSRNLCCFFKIVDWW